VPRYRFSEFVLSPRRRILVRNGRELPLIPRYFDLLVFLIERRSEAVHRREIFERIWSDVIVSDSALSQAIRTIRRVLDDDSREPRFVRTISRHGYRFVFGEVVEEEDDGDWENVPPGLPATTPVPATVVDPFEPLLERVTRASTSPADEEDQREAAELLHALGTSEAMKRLGTRPRHAFARALLRDTRWDTPQAGPVPILGEPAALTTARELVGSPRLDGLAPPWAADSLESRRARPAG
jgi:DNA-binding winged helix-turn-helix (wHTH) protein